MYCKHEKIVLFLIGLIFISCLLLNIDDIYGRFFSMQCVLLLSLLLFLNFCLFLDFNSKIENFIENVAYDAIKVYFSSVVTVSIGFIGFVGIMSSILFGPYYIEYGKERIKEEIQKIENQGWVWLLFIVYFIAVVYVLFIWPMMTRLNKGH